DNEAGIPVFGSRRVLGEPLGLTRDQPVFAAAGIAHPDRFFADLRGSGWSVVGTRGFADHHRYSAADVAGLAREARAAGAAAILTTEKDYVRLRRFRPFEMVVTWAPLTMEPDPLPGFRHWLAGTLDAARDITRV
ncbi:MAG: tetraacyldisaccharide 4'-kinase, partial [Acidobacteria bacterium]|nr:tetraacyldisaccharide 4'-kinase [Acidobacteriota bacterium]